MPFTNSWNETTPTGSDNASTTDDFLRKHRLDLGERLEDMFMGFNAASNASPENNIGVKFLKCYKQDSDPSIGVDFGLIYVKLVSGVPELFFRDDTNTPIQLTSDGNLKSTAGLVIDGASTLTGNVVASGTLDVAGNIDPTTYETTRGGFLDEDAMGSNAANKVASQQSIKAYVDDNVGSANWIPTSYAGEESITFPNGLIMKTGEIVRNGSSTTVTFDVAFSTLKSIQISSLNSSTVNNESTIHNESASGFTIISGTNIDSFYWTAIGY